MNILQVVLPVFLIIALGVLFGKINKKINLDQYILVIFYITAPALALASFCET